MHMSSSTVHPSAVGTNTQPRKSTMSSTENLAVTDEGQGLPPQRHAGAVGLGPEYGHGAGLGERLSGLQEEIKGKIMKKPDLVEHGREMRTGILKQKEQEKDDKEDPFPKSTD